MKKRRKREIMGENNEDKRSNLNRASLIGHHKSEWRCVKRQNVM